MAGRNSDRKAYINRSFGSQGLNLRDPSHIIKEFQVKEFDNATPTLGGFKSRYGFKVFNQDTAKTGGINLLHGFSKSDGTKQLIFALDDDYYYITPSATLSTAWGTIGDYGTASNLITAYTSNDLVIFGTGVDGNAPKKWDGSSFTSITTPVSAAKDLQFFEFFQGQDFAALFGAGHPDNPSTLYHSDTDDPDVWSGGSSGSIDIAVNDGFKITGLKVQDRQLIVYKEKNRYYVSTFYESNTGTYGIRVEPFKDNSGGTKAHETIIVLRNGDIVSLAGEEVGVQGVGKLQAADGSLIPKQYSRDIEPLFKQIKWSIADRAKGVVYDDILWLAVPIGEAATTNTHVVRYHIDRDAWDVIPDLAIGDWEVFFDADDNEVLYAASADTPQIYVFDKNTFTDKDIKITTKTRSGKINLGSIFDREKLKVMSWEGFKQEGDELELIVDVDGKETEYTIDNNFLVQVSGGKGYLSTEYLSESYLSSGASAETDLRWVAYLLINGEQNLGREVQVAFKNKNKGASWGVSHFSIEEVSIKETIKMPSKHVIANQG